MTETCHEAASCLAYCTFTVQLDELMSWHQVAYVYSGKARQCVLSKEKQEKDFMVIALCQLSQPVEVVSSGGLLTTLFMKTMSSVCLPSIFCYACQPVFSMSSQLSLVMYRYWRACSASGSQYGRPLRAVGFPCPRSPSGFLLTVIFGVCSWKGGFGRYFCTLCLDWTKRKYFHVVAVVEIRQTKKRSIRAELWELWT